MATERGGVQEQRVLAQEVDGSVKASPPAAGAAIAAAGAAIAAAAKASPPAAALSGAAHYLPLGS